jgi:hypothetical protein
LNQDLGAAEKFDGSEDVLAFGLPRQIRWKRDRLPTR